MLKFTSLQHFRLFEHPNSRLLLEYSNSNRFRFPSPPNRKAAPWLFPSPALVFCFTARSSPHFFKEKVPISLLVCRVLRLRRVPLLGRAPPLDARCGVALAALVLAPHSAAPVLGLLGVDAIVVRPADQAGVGRGRAGLLPADGQAIALPGRENNIRENVQLCAGLLKVTF